MLKHPTLPLHNNTAELGAKAQARYQDISFHTMSEKGTEAKDIFMTIVETAMKFEGDTYQGFDLHSASYMFNPAQKYK